MKTEEKTGRNYVLAPGGYKFYMEESGSGPNKLSQVSLACSDMDRSVSYWSDLLGMKVHGTKVVDGDDKRVHLSYGVDQVLKQFVYQ